MKVRTNPTITVCPYCQAPEWFNYEGIILIDHYNEGEYDSFFKYWCDHCDRTTLIEQRGCDVEEAE